MDQPHRSANSLRQRKFRQKKLLEDPDYKKKECERIKKIQKKKKAKMTLSEVEELRVRKRMQKRSEREKKRNHNLPSVKSEPQESQNCKSIDPYKCIQSYSMAVFKCLRSLPLCPLKQKRVIQGVCEHLGLKLAEDTKTSLCGS